ncbi:hypothetical protein AAG906_036403 [Vitis piasezkii]|uniref:Uncharacterized protein n=2 Tax=Vitis vinifera TaxID=29760 RepID=F6HKL5_VITVI|nr:uncharacterized protein LOC100254636 [Vitis vinifera]RVX11962.1 hypothetical protein CK203_009623 [Vitis vinifera]WJZ93605.1 hypothetical protein VitviT2T_012532 [Vitis vinifera]|eukprot:XP_002282533.1 PREDICTED: uncharacterized protein LOC100254636 [Vitis vinifera]
MGNCLAQQEKIIKIMRPDGKVLEYKTPLKVQQVLSEFSGCAISDTLPVIQHLRKDMEMVGGQLYYLIPVPLPSPEVEKKALRFSDPQVEADQGTGVVRIRLVITKQELKEMLRKGGVSVDHMVSQLQRGQGRNGVHKLDVDGNGNCRGWKPVLESIPEVN